MNEQIKKLMTQASGVRVSGFGETEILDPEKFAELIVKECADIVVNNAAVNGLDVIRGVLAQQVKEHFGVK